MKTEKIYELDSHISEFTANVVECYKFGEKICVILDRTAFFPEGGGQLSDTGFIGDAIVNDVQTVNGEIIHYTDKAVEKGKVDCRIDWDKRFRRMQNHSGEHIISGIVHKLYGYDNVGFHMGDEITVDFNGELSREQLEKVEFLANEAVCKNVAITAYYPTDEELKKLEYRSKLELTDNVRIVHIDGYDDCACCAPHVTASGEIGIIKILDSMRHRGGIRIRLLCGYDAFDDYKIKCDNLDSISVKLCSKVNGTAEVFDKFFDEYGSLKQKISALQKELISYKIASYGENCDSIVAFEDIDMQSMRTFALSGAKKAAKFCAVFSKNNGGYNFAIASENCDLVSIAKEIKTKLSGKGGGSKELIQGSVNADKNQIQKFLKEVTL